MLDGAPTAAFDGLFMQAIEAAWPLTPFQCLDGRVPIALHGPSTSARARSNARSVRRAGARTAARNTSTPSGPAWWPPATSRSCPCRRSSSRRRTGPRAGLRTQRCETLAGPAWRWPRPSSAGLSRRRSVCLPADRRCHPRCRRQLHPYLQVHLPSDCRRIPAWRRTARTSQAVCKRQTHHHDLPLAERRAAAWHGRCHTGQLVLHRDPQRQGKRTYYNSFVTDLTVTPDSVAELAACGRARWRSRTRPSTCSTNGYNLEHNLATQEHWPASWSPSTCSPSRSTPRPISVFSPGDRRDRAWPATAPSTATTGRRGFRGLVPPPSVHRRSSDEATLRRGLLVLTQPTRA